MNISELEAKRITEEYKTKKYTYDITVEKKETYYLLVPADTKEEAMAEATRIINQERCSPPHIVEKYSVNGIRGRSND